MKWIKALGSFFALIFVAIIYFDFREKKKEKLKVKKEKAKQKILDKINKNNTKYDKVRKSIRDTHSIILKCVTLILLLGSLAHAEYIVWDKEDKVWRDYGTSTNYINVLQSEKEWLIKNRNSNTTIITNSVSTIIDENCTPTWWEDNGDWVSAIGTSIGWGLILLLL